MRHRADEEAGQTGALISGGDLTPPYAMLLAENLVKGALGGGRGDQGETRKGPPGAELALQSPFLVVLFRTTNLWGGEGIRTLDLRHGKVLAATRDAQGRPTRRAYIQLHAS
jgi:hypothetical protein